MTTVKPSEAVAEFGLAYQIGQLRLELKIIQLHCLRALRSLYTDVCFYAVEATVSLVADAEDMTENTVKFIKAEDIDTTFRSDCIGTFRPLQATFNGKG